MTKRSSNDQFSVYLKHKNDHFPLRIVRANGWERMIIRLIHAHIRAHPETAISTINLLKQEFGKVMESKEQIIAFAEYKLALEKKPDDQLGVYVKSDSTNSLRF